MLAGVDPPQASAGPRCGPARGAPRAHDSEGLEVVRKYLEWARHEPSRRQIVVTLVLGAVFFLVLLPQLIAVGAGRLDQALGLPRFTAGMVNRVAGIVCILAGGLFAFWSVLAEATIGSGTPLPMIPTKRLVVVPPFTYCRNPMVLGTVVAYLGFGVWIGSVSAIALVLVFAALLLTYVKVFEEKELEARFGADYVEYKRRTPFLLPRIPKRPQGT